MESHPQNPEFRINPKKLSIMCMGRRIASATGNISPWNMKEFFFLKRFFFRHFNP